MESYFKRHIKYLLLSFSVILVSCNEESIIEGIDTGTQSKMYLINFNNLTIPINTAKSPILDFGNNIKVSLEFTTALITITSTTSQYAFYNIPPTGFRWAMDTYIKKFTSGTIIDDSDFNAGGTPYFINAVYTKPTNAYYYTYTNSFKVNEMGYAAFKYKSGNSTIIGWLSFTSSDSKITLHECVYTSGPTLKIGFK